jgi:hypothetical protein
MKSFLFISVIVLFEFGIAFSQQTSDRQQKNVSGTSMLSDTLDAIHYTIHINNFDFTNHSITARTQVKIESKIDDLDFVKLELLNLTIDSVRVNGLSNSFTYNGSIVTIPLSNPLNTGEMVIVNIFYHGVPFHEDWGGFHWSGNYAFNLGVGFVSIPHNLGKTWFPCIDDFQDRAIYHYYITVPDGMDAVCGGLLAEIINNGNGTRTFVWWNEDPIPTYLASVAVGDYAKWTSIYNGINGNIPVEIWVRPADSNKVANSFIHLNQIMALYEEKFGPYRWDRVGYVGTSIGAMEHVMNVAYPHFAINGNLEYESLYAHELSHMWFGDNVTCASAEDMWLNEGWAVFADALIQQTLYGDAQYKEFMRTKHKEIIQYCHTASGDGSYFPLNQIPQEYTYGMTAYDRGATIAHTLRGYLGDELFFNAMAAYNETYKYNYASSENLRDLLTSETGVNMTPWFDNWVFHSGTPHFSIDSFAVVPNGNGADVTVYLRQKRHGSEFIGNANRVELSFMDNDWNRFDYTFQFDGQTGNAVVTAPFIPELVTIDLNEKMCDATTDYALTVKQVGVINCPNSFFKLDVQSITDSAFVRVEHNWAPPDGLKTPVQGLILSPYRYWKIDGVFPEDFQTKGVFMYNKNGFLDDGLLINSSDSIVILYRQGPAFDWQFIPFTKIGTWMIGNLYIDDLQKGEYTLAVCDDTFVGMNEIRKNNGSGLHIFPNPSNGKFNINTNQPGYLNFFDISGNLLASCLVDDPSKTFTWETNHLDEGTFLVEFQSLSHATIASEKLVLIKN